MSEEIEWLIDGTLEELYRNLLDKRGSNFKINPDKTVVLFTSTSFIKLLENWETFQEYPLNWAVSLVD